LPAFQRCVIEHLQNLKAGKFFLLELSRDSFRKYLGRLADIKTRITLANIKLSFHPNVCNMLAFADLQDHLYLCLLQLQLRI
jgi:hypothetical protein